MAGVNTGRFNAVLNYCVRCSRERGTENRSPPKPQNFHICEVDGMYGCIDTVAIRAMTALKRDGSALIPVSLALVNVLKEVISVDAS